MSFHSEHNLLELWFLHVLQISNTALANANHLALIRYTQSSPLMTTLISGVSRSEITTLLSARCPPYHAPSCPCGSVSGAVVRTVYALDMDETRS